MRLWDKALVRYRYGYYARQTSPSMVLNNNLSDQTAVITGASRGIGREIALQLASTNVNVILAARSEDDLREVARTVEEFQVDTLVVPTDVTNQNDVEQLFRKTFDMFECVDILINNAGRYQHKPRQTWKIPNDEWENVIDVNLNGMYRCAREVLRQGMLDQGEGWIINMSSLFGKTGLKNTSAYAVSKYGIQGLTNTLAKELKGTDIRASAICPGQVETDLTEDIAEVDLMDTEDVVDIVLFVLSQGPDVYIPEVVLMSPDSIPLYQH